MALNTEFKVVINHEEQYSILPINQRLSSGWREVGKRGSKTLYLNYIEEVWTDMSSSDKDRLLRSNKG